jgi:predicted nuclease with RNAse H fold
MDFADIALLGIDVGYSLARPTTGVAWSDKGKFGVAKTHTDWERRQQHIPAVSKFTVIAIDGPLVPIGSPESLDRLCERLFIRGAFQSRCKPGLSHHGFGRDLRRAAAETTAQVLYLAGPNINIEKAIRGGTSIVEAFPNAFLGVLLPEARYASTAGKRKKFDWLYDHAVDAGVFDEVMTTLDWNNAHLLQAIMVERDHKKLAAYVCLLTAACAASSKSEVVGDEHGGWFWLPPVELWAGWARDALAKNWAALSAKGR